MKYAPIIIPTLNRVDHLKKTLYSLCKNEWANRTPLIISVDYPPSEAFIEAYNMMCEYLKNEEKMLNVYFDKVTIIYQSENIGPMENYMFLYNYVKSVGYDRFIFSEDDNVFAKNAIEYLDKALMEFESDESIMAICTNGARGERGYSGGVVKTQNFSAQGYGGWVSKFEIWKRTINQQYLYDLWKDKQYIKKLYHANLGAFFDYKAAVLKDRDLFKTKDGQPPLIDQMIKIFLLKEEKFVITSAITKSLNIGYDGSGVNCDKQKIVYNKLDMSDHFEFGDISNIPIHSVKQKITIKERIMVWGCLAKLWLFFLRAIQL